MRRVDIFVIQFRNPVTDLIVTLRDKSIPLSVKGISDGESGVSSVAVIREVWGI